MRILQDLIADGDPELIDSALMLTDSEVVDTDMRFMIHEIVECGASAHMAAKRLVESGQTARNVKTLYYHARDLEISLIEHLGKLSLGDLLQVLYTERELDCPEEFVGYVEKALESEGRKYEKWTKFTLPERPDGERSTPHKRAENLKG